MAGLLAAAIASGRAISRSGRYKIFPIAGTAILVIGMYLLSRLGVATPPWLASVYMLVVGIGIGLVMQVLVLVVQNDVRPRDIGVATSTNPRTSKKSRLPAIEISISSPSFEIESLDNHRGKTHG